MYMFFPPVNSTVFRNFKWLRSAAERTAYSPLTVYVNTHQTSGGGKAGRFYQIREALSSVPGNAFLTYCLKYAYNFHLVRGVENSISEKGNDMNRKKQNSWKDRKWL